MGMSTNLLIIMADEHARFALGTYGNRIVSTPNLDRLAARGTVFENAYTPCPICVPARAAFATGRYVHETGHWDNSFGYDGVPRSWAHLVRDAGLRVESIGKLHYRDAEANTGFTAQHLPMHVVDGVGDLLGCVREPLPPRWKTRELAEKIGAGETSYTRYDRSVRDETVQWLKDRARDEAHVPGARPWVCFSSMVTPHFPLIAPEPYYSMYAGKVPMPRKPVAPPGGDHPWIAAQRQCFLYDNFTPERVAVALASYFGLVSFMDDNVGRILDTLEETGLAATTRVVYVSDHGENAGERGLWGKSNLYEESAAIPAIIAGPGIPAGHRCTTPVSLVDIHATVLDSVGLAADPAARGQSWIGIANAPDRRGRVVFAEYHAAGAPTGAFMIRRDKWKYVYYPSMPPQLFDLDFDPDEAADLGCDPKYCGVREDLHAALRQLCDPDEVDVRARRDQAAKVAANGGREAIIAKGGFGATPPPGERASYSSRSG